MDIRLIFIIETALLISSVLSCINSTKGYYSTIQICDESSLQEVDGGVWVCGSNPIIDGTMCELNCTDPYSIPEGDYQVTCTPEGWFPDTSQV